MIVSFLIQVADLSTQLTSLQQEKLSIDGELTVLRAEHAQAESAATEAACAAAACKQQLELQLAALQESFGALRTEAEAQLTYGQELEGG